MLYNVVRNIYVLFCRDDIVQYSSGLSALCMSIIISFTRMLEQHTCAVYLVTSARGGVNSATMIQGEFGRPNLPRVLEAISATWQKATY